MISSKILRFLATIAITAGFATVAQAQATRTWVSGVGDDANPCSRTAPCKTFAGAISKTASGGEINVLDPGGFGGVTITKPITISSECFEAGVLVSGTNAIIVNVPNATDIVVLRGLDIEGLGTGINGITVLTGGKVNVEKCTINRFTNNGINFAPTVTNSSLNVLNTIIRNNTLDGIVVTSTGGLVRASLDNVSLTKNGNGLHAKGNSRVVARRSDFNHNSSNGVFAESPTGGQFAVARIWESVLSFNTNGVQAGTGAGLSFIEIAQNQINNNDGNGVLVSTNGTVQTFTNNSIQGNITDACPGCTPIGPGN